MPIHEEIDWHDDDDLDGGSYVHYDVGNQSWFIMHKDQFLHGTLFGNNKFIEVLTIYKYIKKNPPLLVGAYFEIPNGLIGMQRNVVISICLVVSKRPMMSRNLKDRLIATIIGIGQECVAWKSHSKFASCRNRVMWASADPARDELVARIYPANAPRVTGRASPADEMLFMCEVLAAHTHTHDEAADRDRADVVSAHVLDGLLDIAKSPRAVLSQGEKSRWKEIAQARIPVILRWYAASARAVSHRRKACAIVERLQRVLTVAGADGERLSNMAPVRSYAPRDILLVTKEDDEEDDLQERLNRQTEKFF